MSYIGSNKIGKVREGTGYIKRIYLGSDLVFKYTNPVIYHIDDSTSLPKVTRDVEYGASCSGAYTAPTPSSWSPSWKFVGWSTDKTASDDVLTSSDNADKMGHSTVNLYAVFKKVFTLSYANGGGTGTMIAQTITQYYNNGNYSTGDANGVTFTLKANEFSRDNYLFDGWNINSTTKNAGDPITLSGDATATALWKPNNKKYGPFEGKVGNWNGTSSSTKSDIYEVDTKGARAFEYTIWTKKSGENGDLTPPDYGRMHFEYSPYENGTSSIELESGKHQGPGEERTDTGTEYINNMDKCYFFVRASGYAGIVEYEFSITVIY